MSFDSEKIKFDKERIYIVEVDVPRCLLTYGVGACKAGEHEVVTDVITVDDFAVGATITGNTSGATGTITNISGSAPTYTFTYTKTNGIDFDDGETITASGGSSGIATINGDSALVTSGDDWCYNTLATCQALNDYDDDITTGNQTISVNGPNGTFTRSAGSYITDGFEEGQIITTSGNANEENNSQFKISTVTATVITVTNNYGLATETGSGDEVITTKNLFTYGYCESRSPHPQNLNNYAPALRSVSIAPAQINPKGGIGARASVSLGLSDFPSSDRYDIDTYLTERSFNPLEVGQHFTKWRARNAFYENYDCRVLSGFIVDNAFDRSNFQTRNYVLSSMTATGGAADFTAKDPLQKISNKKALAPKPSNGALNASITAGATSIALKPTGIGDDEYPANTAGSNNFYVSIRDEVMLCTNRSGDTLTVTRAQKNTVADAHDADDTVQLCLQFTGKTVDEVQAELCIDYAEINPIYIPKSQWNAEASTYLSQNPDALITTPTSVQTLIGELCEQWPHKLFWNDRQGYIQFEAVKAPPASANVVDMDGEIIADSFSTRDRPDMQLSTIFVYYGQFDPTKKIDEEDNYQITYARVNTDASRRYNSNQTKTIFSRWITTAGGAGARQMAALLGRRFGFTPREIGFSMEVKDSSLWIGETRAVNHRDIVDQNGNPVDTIFEILTAKEDGFYQYRALEYDFDAELDEDEGGGDPDVDLVLISLDDLNINLRTIYDGLFPTPDGTTKAKFVVEGGVIIGGTGSGISLDTGSWPAGALVTLQINSGAFVVGQGGSATSTNGGAGYDAIILNHDLTLINNGVIGGGGGAGGSADDTKGGVTAYAGGGGGAGGNVGLGQASSLSFGTGIAPNGGDGTTESGGTAGFAESGVSEALATAGAGGDLGQDGDNATEGNNQYNGGSAGNAIDKNGYTLTETVTGDIRGSVIA